ncbi:MAG: hypothetical protein RDU24_13660 [Humidesulfovibrio sp.]|uniref:hypothetical protein n=1 Tax=Humidesulfovibrio sp. TaxID=2910988 RepID=UPI0027F876F3|nr:hypothetical protein [Humidesulfovibrio sp.]MDQ7836423.1 hypothetical protein [Humidesulfovibrio sp.]
MRSYQAIPVLVALLLAALLLAACGSTPKVDRVDVTWSSLSPAPRWGLYPGYRQEIEFRPLSAYTVDFFSGGKVVTGGTVGDTGASLVFVASAGARDVSAQSEGPGKLTITVTLKDEKGGTHPQVCLRVERQGDKIWFEFPK